MRITIPLILLVSASLLFGQHKSTWLKLLPDVHLIKLTLPNGESIFIKEINRTLHLDPSSVTQFHTSLCEYFEPTTKDPHSEGCIVPKDTQQAHSCPSKILNFNCHSFTFSNHPELSKVLNAHMWIDGDSIAETLWTHPTRRILDSYYRRKKAVSREQLNKIRLKNVQVSYLHELLDLKVDDVVVLRDTKSDHFIHSGILYTANCDEAAMVLSKLGRGPLTRMSLEKLMDYYAYASWDVLEIYQFLP